MDIGDICLYCEEHNCMACREGNPCLGCSDYDRDNDTCISNGGCGKQTKEQKKQQAPDIPGVFCYGKAKLLYTGYETEIVTEKKGEIYVHKM